MSLLQGGTLSIQGGMTVRAVSLLNVRPALGELPQLGLRALDRGNGRQYIGHSGLLLQEGGLHGRSPVQG